MDNTRILVGSIDIETKARLKIDEIPLRCKIEKYTLGSIVVHDDKLLEIRPGIEDHLAYTNQMISDMRDVIVELESMKTYLVWSLEELDKNHEIFTAELAKKAKENHKAQLKNEE